MEVHPVTAAPVDLETGHEPLGPVLTASRYGAQADISPDSSPANTMYDDNTLARANTYTQAQYEELRQTLSKRSTGGDPLDLEHNFSLEKYIRELLSRGERQGVKTRQAGVVFRDVSTYGVGAGLSFQETIFDPLLLPFRLGRSSVGKKSTKKIISNFNGVVKAGEMLLVLGKPGSGCTTFLKTVAGEHNGYKKVEGSINFDGIPQKTMTTMYKGEIVYNGELDNHFPHLTVSQTLSFAASTRAPQAEARIDGKSRAEYTADMRDVLATTFGLRHTYNTKVGNDYVRGVSGGERKRVSIAETLSSRAQVQMWDNSTRGLDASTALEYAKALRVSTNLSKSTCLVCVYQAGEQLYEVFDKVTVVYAGQQIYFGPTELAKQYFIDMGFDCPARQTTADFLTAITDPNARFAREGFSQKVPKTPEEFAQRWVASDDYKSMIADMDSYENSHDTNEKLQEYRESTTQEKAKRVGSKSPYTISYQMQLKACAKRSYQRMLGDPAFLGANIFASIFQSLIVGSVFYNISEDTSGFFSRGGVLFFAILFNALQAMSEVASLYEQRPIIARHKSYALYHPSADALAQLVADIPIKLATLTCFDVILYFLTNLSRTPQQFFIFYLFTFLTTMCMLSFFRMLASITKTVDVALTLAGIGVLALVIYTGYVIPTDQTGWWFRWLSYINPIQYGFEALMVNEFHNYSAAPCASISITPSGAGYDNAANQVCAVTGSVAGSLTVSGPSYLSASYSYSYSHLWRNLGIIIAFWLFFLLINVVATEFIAPVAEGGDVVLFRHGHVPKSVEKAAAKGKSPDLENQDVAVPEGEARYEEDAKDNDSTMGAIAKSTDIFTWRNLKYDINIKGEKRRLLADVQGYVKPGTLTALMGESGAGKTTLLNVLAQRVDTGVVTGDMFVNGSPLDHSFQRKTGYVQQQDVHMGESTVRESLRFSAMLRQPRTVSRKEKYEYVEEVIKLLEMEDYAEAVVGEPGVGLNVEQRKRLTIGVELAAKPKLLLFLDEPTSGLDSQSAWSIVLFMRKLANAGQAILCTIHQPSAVLFEQFDRLLLLQKGGKTVYFGDIGKNSKTMIDYFERQGAGKCGRTDNPAEYILDAIGAGATAHTDKDWFELWNESPECENVSKELDQLYTELRQRSAYDKDPKVSATTYAMPYSTQFAYVTKRIFTRYTRAPTYIFAKLALNVVAGLFVGFTFYKSGQGVQAQQNKLFSIFMATVISSTLMNQLQPQFVQVRNLFEVREKPSKMYSWVAFVVSAILVEIPYNIVCGTLFFLPWFYCIGYYKDASLEGRTAASIGIYEWLMLMSFEMWFSTFGQLCASFVPNEQTAAIVSTLMFTFVILFNGVLQPVSQLVTFWHWMYRLTPFTYLIEGLTVNVLHGLPIVCLDTEVNTFIAPETQTCTEYIEPFFAAGGNGYLTSSSSTAAGGSCVYCRYSTGDQYLTGLSMNYDHRWRDFGLMFAYILFNMFFTALLFWMFRVWKFKFSRGTSKTAGKTQQAADAFADKTKAGASGATEAAAVTPRSNVGTGADSSVKGGGGVSGP